MPIGVRREKMASGGRTSPSGAKKQRESGILARSRGVRGQLTDLLLRQGRGLKAIAVSTKNADLLAKLPTRPSDIKKLRETDFAEEARRLLDLGQPHAEALVKRHFAKAKGTEAEALLTTYNTTVVGKRADVTDGSTGRLAVEQLLKDNSRIMKELGTFFELYKDDEDEADVYDKFRAVSKVVRRGGQDGPVKPAE
jgi:hypothetical protein